MKPALTLETQQPDKLSLVRGSIWVASFPPTSPPRISDRGLYSFWAGLPRRLINENHLHQTSWSHLPSAGSPQAPPCCSLLTASHSTNPGSLCKPPEAARWCHTGRAWNSRSRPLYSICTCCQDGYKPRPNPQGTPEGCLPSCMVSCACPSRVPTPDTLLRLSGLSCGPGLATKPRASVQPPFSGTGLPAFPPGPSCRP